MFWSATYMSKSPKISTFSYFDEVNPINHLTPWGGFQYNICGDCRNNLVSTCHYAGWIRYKCLFFYECPRLEFWKFEKYIFGHKISQKVIFYVETWSRDQFLGFTFLFFFQEHIRCSYSMRCIFEAIFVNLSKYTSLIVQIYGRTSKSTFLSILGIVCSKL